VDSRPTFQRVWGTYNISLFIEEENGRDMGSAFFISSLLIKSKETTSKGKVTLSNYLHDFTLPMPG